MACTVDPLSLELVKVVLTALATLTVGIVAGVIAWRQHRTAQAKLKLDLFDKRYAIFESTWKFMSETFRDGPGLSVLTPFDNLIPQAEFLFGPELSGYLRLVSSKRTALWAIERRTHESPNQTVHPDDVEPRLELQTWFFNEAKTVKDRFAPYLSFQSLR